jgi:peptidoglycan/xylan/chitin deacetylase (PgdA/CDA1 family)
VARTLRKIVARDQPCCGKHLSVESRLLTGFERAFLWLIFLALAVGPSALASDVLFLTKSGPGALEDQVLRASRFYGLGVQILSIDSSLDSARITRALNDPSAFAVIVSADILSDLDHVATLKSLRRANGSRIPLLIVATGSRDTSQGLSDWSGGRIQDCKAIENHIGEWHMRFVGEADLVHQLAGFAPKSATGPTCGFVLSHDPSTQVLAEMQNETEKFPALINFPMEDQPVFAVTAMRPIGKVESSGAATLQEAFSSVAGLLIFLRKAAGERVWHTPAYYANLTVDDPWLTEPYGNLGYEALLHEMEKHNFHTTIAFVPWNFDRSEPEVVSLFHNHADRFSISIHGNNHNHREFGEYSTQPLNRQRENVEQALARMEQFKRVTGLPYDRVMVFPHAVAPTETLEALKEHNYWATVNSENVPLGSTVPNDPLFPLTPWTLEFKGFPSVKRISAEIPVSATDIAINAFLGNPQLFYVHQEFFEDKIGAFNATADEINSLEPMVQWKSLGYIIRHLYLTRLRSDQDYDVLVISPNLELVNPTDRRVVFHVHKPEDPIPPSSVVVNGSPISYQAALNEIRFDVILEPKQGTDVDISYGEDSTFVSADISKRSALITMDRRLSDFRDRQLSRSTFGRKIQFVYYNYGLDRLERLIERSIVILVVIITGYLLLSLALVRRKRKCTIVK